MFKITIGIDGVLKLMENVSNRKAKFVQALGFCEYRKEPMIFVSITNGTIAEESMGCYG